MGNLSTLRWSSEVCITHFIAFIHNYSKLSLNIFITEYQKFCQRRSSMQAADKAIVLKVTKKIVFSRVTSYNSMIVMYAYLLFI